MADDFVQIDDPGSVDPEEAFLEDVQSSDLLDEVEASPAPPVDEPQQSDESSVPAASLDALPSSEDPSVSDVLDSFLAGVLTGVSADQEAPSSGSVSEPVEDLDEPVVCVGVESYSLSPVTSSSGLKGVLLDVLGPYDTVVTQYKYQQGSNQYYSYVNDIQPDYPWLASAVLFIVMIWSLFALFRRCLFWMK